MQTSISALRSLTPAALLLALGLATAAQPAYAQQAAAPSAAPAAINPLRVIITPLANSSVLRVRYESADYGAVRLQIRNEQGQVLYADLKRQSRFAGDFDLAAWPAGDYTIELSTPNARRTETVRVSGGSRRVVASLLAAN